MNFIAQLFTDHRFLMIAMLLMAAALGFAGAVVLNATLRRLLGELLPKILDNKGWNSRFVFLLNGAATAVGILAVSVGFLFVEDRSYFPVMVATLGGGGVGAAIGRFYTKRGDTTPGSKPEPAKPATPVAPVSPK